MEQRSRIYRKSACFAFFLGRFRRLANLKQSRRRFLVVIFPPTGEVFKAFLHQYRGWARRA